MRKKRTLSLFIVLCMVANLFSVTTFANVPQLTPFSIDTFTTANERLAVDVSNSNVIINDGEAGGLKVEYTKSGETVATEEQISNSATIVITGARVNQSDSVILVNTSADRVVNIELDGVNIDVSGQASAFSIKDTSKVNLKITKTNALANLQMEAASELTICGDGILNAKGGIGAIGKVIINGVIVTAESISSSVEKNNCMVNYEVFGKFNLKQNYTIPTGATMTVANNSEFIISNGFTLINSGTITNAGIFTNDGTINNSGTLDGDGNYSGSGEIKTPLTEDMISVVENNNVYTGSEIQPNIIVAINNYSTYIKDYDYTLAYTNNINVGTATITITPMGNLSGTPVVKTFEIKKSETVFKYGIEVFYKDNQKTNTFTYGDTITVKVTAEATGTQARIAPEANQMALYIGEKQISNAVNAVDGVYTMLYNTTAKLHESGINNITAKFVGNDNMENHEESVDVTINKIQLSWDANGTVSSKVYDTNTTAIVATQPTLSGVISGDAVTVKNGTVVFASANAGVNKVIASDFTIEGKDSANYAILTQPIFADGTIDVKNITPTIIINGTYTYTGSQIKPEITVKDAEETLTANDYTVEYGENINAGKGSVNVILKGNYSGNQTAEFTITKLDISVLVEAIKIAKNTKANIIVDDRTPARVGVGIKFVSTAVMNTFNEAITKAEAATAVIKTAKELEDAVAAINSAVTTFNKSIQTGRYVKHDSDEGSPDIGGKVNYNTITPIITTSNNVSTAIATDTNILSAIKNNENVEIIMKTPSSSKKAVLQISRNSLNTLANSRADGLKIITGIGELLIDKLAMENIAEKANTTTVNISISTVDNETQLNRKQLAVAEDLPVFELSIVSGQKDITNFGRGEINVSIPHTIGSRQKAENVVVWYMDQDGNTENMDTVYSTRNEIVTFSTSHFSLFVIGYKEEPVVEEKPEAEKPKPEEPAYTFTFVDVPTSEYYYNAVLWAVREGITSGISANAFGPQNVCTRGQMVSFLWRAKGSPEPTNTFNPYIDVSKDAYYYKAVLWAVEKGITSGTSMNTFSPNANCTRAQMATFLWRMAGSPTVNNGTNFIDIETNGYYRTAVNWAVDQGVTSGTSANTFSPNSICTRAQMVTLLYRYFN